MGKQNIITIHHGIGQYKSLHTTHGIVHAGFSGLRWFVARKKVQCSLIGNRLVLPRDTIPSTLCVIKKTSKNDRFRNQ